jgi:hypothetical protein
MIPSFPFPTKNLCVYLSSEIYATCPAHLIILNLIILIILERVQTLKVVTARFSSDSCFVLSLLLNNLYYKLLEGVSIQFNKIVP